MTTHPGECERSAESCGAGVWAAAQSNEHAKKATLTAEARRRGELSMWSTAALGCGAGDCGLVSSFGLEDHAMENDFDLLMENASHSYEIQYGVQKSAAGGDTIALAANRSKESALQSWARLFWPSAHWWSLE